MNERKQIYLSYGPGDEQNRELTARMERLEVQHKVSVFRPVSPSNSTRNISHFHDELQRADLYVAFSGHKLSNSIRNEIEYFHSLGRVWHSCLLITPNSHHAAFTYGKGYCIRYSPTISSGYQDISTILNRDCLVGWHPDEYNSARCFIAMGMILKLMEM